VEVDALPRSEALQRRMAAPTRELALSCLLAGGDDYELCFTAPRACDAAIAALSARLDLALSKVGATTPTRGLIVRDSNGTLQPIPRGFDHFAA
jgi:thiamine-monophosphate kinase